MFRLLFRIALFGACMLSAGGLYAGVDRVGAFRESYPATRADPIAEQRYGETVSDPYRWLEADVRQSDSVSNWVAAQNSVTRRYLDQLPGREALRSRIKASLDFERFSIPQKAGRRYFYMRNSGLQNQPVLWVREGLNGKARVLIDPNLWSQDGTVALDQWRPSPDGRFVAYSVQEGGSDWRKIRFIEVRSGKVLPDELELVNDSELAWVALLSHVTMAAVSALVKLSPER